MIDIDTKEKNHPTYLDIAANGSGEEKASLTLEAIRRLFDRNNESVHVVDVGPGGGSAVKAVADAIGHSLEIDRDRSLHVSLLEIDGIESNSLIQSRSALTEKGVTSSFHRTNVVDIASQFPDKVDVISTSAVLHEVYSYSGGFDALDTSIRGIAQALRPGGFFAYRDVYGVENLSQHERVRHIYDRRTWVTFATMFLPEYLEKATHPYHRNEDRIQYNQNGREVKLGEVKSTEPLSIEAPIGILRELQRHYITFRDHVWRSGALGVAPVLDGELSNDWLDKRRGQKRVHYELLESDPALESMSTRSENGLLVVDGDIFDETTDVLMSEFLDNIHLHGEHSSGWDVWQSWLRREGIETYVYMSLNHLLGSVALRSFDASGGEIILLPTSQDDIALIPRTYYNRYLKQKLSNPLLDAKQLVLFEAVTLQNVRNNNDREVLANKVSGALAAFSVYCSKETVASIYSPLRKALR